MSRAPHRHSGLSPIALALAMAFSAATLGCRGGSGVSVGSEVIGNENGSEPINDQEAVEYNKAIVRCYKTGGTRVVKILGILRCY